MNIHFCDNHAPHAPHYWGDDLPMAGSWDCPGSDNNNLQAARVESAQFLENLDTLVWKIEDEGLDYVLTDYSDLLVEVGLGRHVDRAKAGRTALLASLNHLLKENGLATVDVWPSN